MFFIVFLSYLPSLQLVGKIFLFHAVKDGGVVLIQAELVLYIGVNNLERLGEGL